MTARRNAQNIRQALNQVGQDVARLPWDWPRNGRKLTLTGPWPVPTWRQLWDRRHAARSLQRDYLDWDALDRVTLHDGTPLRVTAKRTTHA